jgi:hypothetical protein
VKNSRVKIKCIVLAAIVLFLGACLGPQMQNVKSYSEMTPKEKVGFAMSLYNDAAGEYMWLFQTKTANGPLSEDDRKFLHKYWNSLNVSHLPIATYDTWVKAGTLPTQDMEDELVTIIRTLSTLAE